MAEARRPRISKEGLRRYFDERNLQVLQCNETPGQISVDFAVRSLTGTKYTLRLYIPEDFPLSNPTLAVVQPPNLLQRNGTAIPENAAEFQTLGRTHEGFQRISPRYSTTNPNAGIFIHQIVMNGTLWLNAYEQHVATGVVLAHYIQQYRHAENESHSAPMQFWSDAQVRHLALERDRLHEYFGRGKVTWHNDRRAVDVTITSSQQKTYILRVHFHHDYPNSCPSLAVVYPEELFQENGQPLPLHSQEFRTLGKKDGRLLICHFAPSEWMDNCKITRVFMKGLVWVNAYEQYSGQNDKSFQDCLRELNQCSEKCAE